MEAQLRRWLHDAGQLGCRFENTWFACSMDHSKLALDHWSGAYTCERALYPHRHYTNHKLEAIPVADADPKSRAMLILCGKLHAIRTLLGVSATLAYLWALH